MMNLTPTEIERLLIYSAAQFARRNLDADVPLSHPEAVAILTDEAMFLARQGLAYDEIRDRMGRLLTEDDVQPGVASMIKRVLIELPMAEGTKLLVLFDPVLASEHSVSFVPGEVIGEDKQIDLLAGGGLLELDVTNTGDRDVQVRSQTHFFEVNRALIFDRQAAYGMRLAVASGSGVRFEPGVPKRVPLIPIGGSRRIYGFASLVEGDLDDNDVKERALQLARERGYLETDHTNDFD